MTHLLAWARARLPMATFGPLALLLVIAAGARDPVRWALAALLVVTLRLVDDLSDLPHDRLAHPGRVLSRARSTAPFVALALLLALGSLGVAVALGGHAPALLAGLAAALLVLPSLVPWRRARALVSLGKYAVVVLSLAPAPAALPALVTWSAFVAHEVLHDRSLRGPATTAALWLALGGLVVATTLASGPLVAAAVGVLAAWLARRHARAHAPGAWCRAPFLLALPPLLAGASA